MCPS
jgi:hypothetical protein